MAIKAKNSRRVAALKPKGHPAARTAATRATERSKKSRLRERLSPAMLKALIQESPIHPASNERPAKPPFEFQDD